jgi:signal transduction histidine kinase
MQSDANQASNLSPQALKAVYDISRVILQAVDTSAALQSIIPLARPVFIFDNAVIYQLKENGLLEPFYARALGRGRSSEADMAWGESVANEVLAQQKMIIRREDVGEREKEASPDRLHLRDFLGLPLWLGEQLKGVLVFIRFGGPQYLPEHVMLAELIAEHIMQLLERQHLVQRIASLEAERKLSRLQEEFIATITHDLRSPLGFIKGYATSLLREDVEWDQETSREFLAIIDDEADRLTELIDNLLDTSRLQSGTLRMDFQPVQLDTMLRDFAQRVRVNHATINLQLELPDRGVTIWAAPARLAQVFDNLVDNAIKYAPHAIVTIWMAEEPEQVHVILRDSGPGIPPEHLEDIFKRFYRLPSHIATERGSGLGLFICREIIQAHGGTIYADSAPGKGTAFHILLPYTQPMG